MSRPVLPETATRFVESILALNLKLAVFDCDGTLWSGDAGRDFFYWEIERGIVSAGVAKAMIERYRLYEQGVVDELSMCGEMVTMHSGLAVKELYPAAQQFFDEVVSHRIFPEMLELTRRLAESGCELWAVSSTNDWVVEAGVKPFGILPERVLAACVSAHNDVATDQLIRVPTDELKAVAIREVIGRPIDAVFGNSVHDQAMLEIARYPFCINPSPHLAEIAEEKGWPIYRPTSALRT